MQEKLLRVIEYGEFERVGGGETLVADVRVVAAANVDLPARAASGKFRADLLDRLAFDVIHAPPLRTRKEDIPILAAHFASVFAREINERGDAVRFEGFTSEAMAALVAHDWPGNVRELKNAAERSFYRWIASGGAGPVDIVVVDPFSGGRLAENLHASDARRAPLEEALSLPTRPRGSYNLRERLDEIERDWVMEALAIHAGSQKRAADFLKLSYDQMRGLVRKHELAKRA